MRTIITIILSLFSAVVTLFGQSVGTLQGNFEVDMNGAANYSVSIYTPPGTNGMQPNISLVYSSLGGTGVMGVGWNIGGLSSITRVPQNKYLDGNIRGLHYDNQDRFMLDGQRLFPLDNNYSLYGLNGTVYRTENENFSRVYSYSVNSNYPTRFEVYAKDGKIIEYEECVIDPQTNVPISWLITKVTDANGNYIEFDYNDYYGSSIPFTNYGLQNYYQSAVLISNIKYTGNDAANLEPYNEIWFYYDDNNSYEHWYGNNGNLFSSKYRISRIESKAYGNIVRAYDFEYDETSSTTQYFLHSITESNSVGEFYNSTVFTWDKSLEHTDDGLEYDSYFENTYYVNPDFGRTATNTNWGEKMERLVGDLNGDGLSDIVALKGKSYPWYSFLWNNDDDDILSLKKIGINNGVGFDVYNKNSSDFRLNKIICAVLFDENGDGKDELIITRRKEMNSGFPFMPDDTSYIDFYKYDPNTVDGFSCYKTYTLDGNNLYPKFGNYDKLISPPTNNVTVFMRVADVNGDALPDIIYVKQYESEFRVVLNTGNQDQNITNSYYQLIPVNNRRFFLSDVNGDGLADFVLFANNNVYVYFSNGDGTFATPIVSLSGHFTNNQGWNENHEIQMLDINADGLSDIIGIKGGIIYVGLSLGDKFIFKGGCGNVARGDDTVATLQYPLQIRDVNNDGLPDIVFFAYGGVEILLNDNSNTNDIFPHFTSIGLQNNLFGYSSGWSEEYYRRTAGDFNGDGVVDIFAFELNTVAILQGKPNYPARITAITDGLGNRTEINYQYRRNDMSVVDNTISSLFFRLLPIGPSILVGNVMKEANGIGEIFNTDYTFANPVFEMSGKGFLGFRLVKQEDKINDVRVITYSQYIDYNVLQYATDNITNNIFNEYPLVVPLLVEKRKNRYLISEINYDYYYLCGFNSNKSYTLLPKQISEYNYFENSSKRTFYLYNNINEYPTGYINADDNLNLISQITSYYDGIGCSNSDNQKFNERKRMFYENTGIRNFKLVADTTEKFQIMYNTDNHIKIWTDYEYNNDINLSRSVTKASYYGSYGFNYTTPQTQITEYDYDVFGNLISKEISGRVTTYEYDDRGQFVTNTVSPSGDEISYTYEDGNLVSTTNINNNLTTSYNYDSWGNRISTTYPDGSVFYHGVLQWNNDIDAPGLYYEESRKDNVNGVLLNKRYYNSIGQELLSISYSGFDGANDVRTETEYNEKGLVSRKSFPYKGATDWTDYEYDEYNRLISKLGPGEHIAYEYGCRTMLQTDILNNTEYSNVKDALGRTIIVTDPGGTINYTYNVLGLPKTISSNGMTTNLKYDAFGNRTQISEPNSGITNSVYNNFGELTLQTDAENTYQYIYDLAGRLIEENIEGPNLEDGSINYYYNEVTGFLDSVKSLLPDSLHKVEFTYDNLGRLVNKKSTLADSIFNSSFAYCPQSSLIHTITYPTGLEVNYTYNEYGELINLVGVIPTDISMMCSKSQRPIRINGYPNSPIPQIYYEARRKNHFNQITDFMWGIPGNNLYTEYDFNMLGQIEGIRTMANSGFIQNLHYECPPAQSWKVTEKECMVTNQTESYSYDKMNRLERVITNSPYGSKILSMAYSDNGNIISKTDFGDYDYDASRPNGVNQVIPAPGFTQTAETNTDYLFGNKVMTLSSIDDYASLGYCNTTLYYGYDKQRIISKDRRLYYENGLVLRRFVDKYYEEEWYYTEIRELLGVVNVIDAETLEVSGVRFRGSIAPDNIEHTEHPGFVIMTGQTALSAVPVLVEYPIPDALLPHIRFRETLHDIRKLHYIFAEDDALVGIYVVREHPGGDSMHINGNWVTTDGYIQDTMYYVHQDRLGSYAVITDDTGQVKQRLGYDVWGNRVLDTNWSVRAEFDNGDFDYIFRRGFTGHEHLGSFGIINMNGRIYDPNIASFFSPDPFVVDATSTQAFNRYSYCLNNPLMYTDPSGELVWFVPVIIGAVIGAYSGGTIANDGEMNPFNWDYSSGKTWGYMLGGAVAGGLSAGVGGAIAGSGIPFANTLGIMGASLTNSLGTHIYTGGQTDITMSIGFGSYNFTSGKFSTFSTENSWLENLGYGFGALANIQDAVAFFTGGGTNVDVNSASTKGDNEWWGHSSITDPNTDATLLAVNNRANNLVSFGPEPLFDESLGLTHSYGAVEWDNYYGANGTWTVRLNNVSKTALTNYSNSVTKWDLFFNSCVGHTSRALFRAGVLTLPINFHPHILNAQLFIRQLGISASPYLYNGGRK